MIEVGCHIHPVFRHVITDITHIQELIILDALSSQPQLEEFIIAHRQRRIDSLGDKKIDAREERDPLDAKSVFLIHSYWKLTKTNPPIAHLFAFQALLAIQRRVGDDQ